jgi:hypothetical protein
MALADYRLCDVCRQKTFYDPSFNFEPNENPDDDLGPVRGRLGAWRVICVDCAKTHVVVVLEKEKAEHAVIIDRLRELGDVS